MIDCILATLWCIVNICLSVAYVFLSRIRKSVITGTTCAVQIRKYNEYAVDDSNTIN